MFSIKLIISQLRFCFIPFYRLLLGTCPRARARVGIDKFFIHQFHSLDTVSSSRRVGCCLIDEWFFLSPSLFRGTMHWCLSLLRVQLDCHLIPAINIWFDLRQPLSNTLDVQQRRIEMNIHCQCRWCWCCYRCDNILQSIAVANATALDVIRNPFPAWMIWNFRVHWALMAKTT